MAAELADELQRRKRPEADTRKAQAVLGVEAEGRRADQARAAGLEKQVGTVIIISSSTRSLLHRPLGSVTSADHFFH